MKNVIVGIDFSNNSLTVLRHAIAVAMRFDATLHLVWIKTPGVTKTMNIPDFPEHSDAYVKFAEQKLDQLVDDTQREAKNCDVQKVILQGKAHIELCQYANNFSDALLAIGTHGVSGFEERSVGSNTIRMISLSKIPVLTLREGINIHRDLTEILVPIDSSFETLQKIKQSIDFAKAFNAKVKLVGLFTPDSYESKNIINIQLNHAKHMCERANVRFDVDAVSTKNNAEKTIVEYAKFTDVNLLVVMREEEDEFSDFWLGNTMSRLLITTPMPMLIIPNKDHITVGK